MLEEEDDQTLLEGISLPVEIMAEKNCEIEHEEAI